MEHKCIEVGMRANKIHGDKGFTLPELLVAIAVFGIVISAIYATYASSQRSYARVSEISYMVQNIRAGIAVMEKEIRMAGYDPTNSANAGITNAGSSSITITQDLNADGDTSDTDESVTFSLADSDGDGDTDLVRNNVLLAENIDALNFVYLDENGAVTANLSDIRSVQITIVARTAKADKGYTDTQSYANQQGTVILVAQNDHFRRRRLTSEVRCRNLGL
ncbi:MAG TPA: prepilin-type N-terminal cleavage/methylation domain-containing protein [Desulfobacteraceae bacterium]|nr:prepilin-type N-terminal cleavage/methylation domain-containing protein [Desulfobacteraceae bacterium]